VEINVAEEPRVSGFLSCNTCGIRWHLIDQTFIGGNNLSRNRLLFDMPSSHTKSIVHSIMVYCCIEGLKKSETRPQTSVFGHCSKSVSPAQYRQPMTSMKHLAYHAPAVYQAGDSLLCGASRSQRGKASRLVCSGCRSIQVFLMAKQPLVRSNAV